MIRQFSTRRIVGFFLFDLFGTMAMLLTAAYLRVDLVRLPQPARNAADALEVTLGGIQTGTQTTSVFSLASQVFVLVALIWPLFFVLFSVYDGRKSATLRQELGRAFLAISAATLTLAGMLFFTYRGTSRLLILIFFVLDVALLLGGRALFCIYRRSGNGRYGPGCRRVLIVGAGDVGRKAANQLDELASANILLVGYVDDDPDKQNRRYEGLPVLGTCAAIPQLAEAHGVQQAVVALPLRAHDRIFEVCKMLQDLMVRVHVIPDLFTLSFPSATLDGFGGIPVIDLGHPGIYGLRRLSKRLLDVAVASILLVIFFPLCALVAILIKIESPGPVLFRQQRVGENGQPLTCLKFRSMRSDADASLHKAYVSRLIKQNIGPEQLGNNGQQSLKLEADPRITRVGRIIRRSSIDELPQLANVLRGEMSMVGPRPPIAYEVDLYETWHRRRLEALPGITGWWQVKGRNRVSFDEMVRMDLHYIENSSFWFDLKILLMTPWAMISGGGAG